MTTPYEAAAAVVEGGALPTAQIEGETFTLHGELSALDMSELARAADLDSESVEGAAVLADLFRAAFGDHVREGKAEYARFRRHMRGRGDDALIASIGALVEAFAGFPTPRPSASQPGPSTSTDSSRAAGSPQDAPASQETVVGEVVSADVNEDGQTPSPAEGATVVNIGRLVS